MIFKFLVLFCLLISSQALPTLEGKLQYEAVIQQPLALSQVDSRIMGGTNATKGQIPFQVGIISKDFVSSDGFCGGTLVSDTVVITAAHCVSGYIEYDVILGTLLVLNPNSEGYKKYTTRNVVVHEEYDFNFGLNNDIALLIFDTPIPFTDTIKPILMPSLRDVNTDFVGQLARTSGWGKVGDVPGGFLNEYLLYVDVQILINYICEYSYGSAYVPPTKICLSTHEGAKGACNGDSGGPAFLTNSEGEEIFIGIVSFGARGGCEQMYPEVYTRITSFLDWVETNGGPAVRP